MSTEKKPPTHIGFRNALKVILGFYLVLFLLNLLTLWGEGLQTPEDGILLQSTHRTLGALFGLVDILSTVKAVAVGGFLTWLALRFAFPKTLGFDFGDEFDEGWKSLENTERTKWIIVAFLAIFFATVHGRAHAQDSSRPVPVANLALPVSVEARDMVIYYEVGGRSYYERSLTKPEVPAWQTTSSGVTVGFGVDVGQMTEAQINNAFAGVLPPSMVSSLQTARGLKGRAAYYNALPKVKNTVLVTWDQATAVFERDTLPRFTRQTRDAFHIEVGQLHPSSNGALTSLVFNRGGAMGGDSRREMRQIVEDLENGEPENVPGRLRAMKRLWPYDTLKGLHLRRDAEAAMFLRGLKLQASS